MTAAPVSPTLRLRYRSLVTLISLSVVVVGLGWKLLSKSKGRSMVIRTDVQAANRHPDYWFDDGSVIVKASDDYTSTVLFRIHASLLRRHTKRVLEPTSEDGWDVPIVPIPSALGVHVQDFTALLAHLYHDIPLSLDAPFHHVAAVLRVTSPEQLDIPSVHRSAKAYIVAMFPSGPAPFVHPDHLEEALALTVRYDIPSIQKGIYYSLMTRTDFEPNPDPAAAQASQPDAGCSKTTTLTPTDVVRCRQLMNGIVAHFTPVLFEPPVTPDMACSSIMGEKWFPLVVQPAIAGNSVYKPLEALEQLKRIDWTAEGVCEGCVKERREVWTNAQEEVWAKMDEWLGLVSVSVSEGVTARVSGTYMTT